MARRKNKRNRLYINQQGIPRQVAQHLHSPQALHNFLLDQDLEALKKMHRLTTDGGIKKLLAVHIEGKSGNAEVAEGLKNWQAPSDSV